MFLYRKIEVNLCRFSIVTACVYRHIPIRSYSVGKMNFGKSGSKGLIPSGNTSSRFHSQVVGARNKNHLSMQNKHQSASASVPDISNEEEFPRLGVKLASSSKDEQFSKTKMGIDLGPEQKTENNVSSPLENLDFLNDANQHDQSSPSTPYRKKGMRMRPAHFKTPVSSRIYHKHGAGTKKLDSSEGSGNIVPFDICFSSTRYYRERRGLVYTEDMEKENEKEQTVEGTREGVLRPGMVLLKHYLSIHEQIRIVRTCQKLGKSPGGFYQPGYSNGARLRLQMMCLGLNWDPQTRKYEKRHPVNGCEPPGIPHDFSQLVQRAITSAHALIKLDSEISNVEGILPTMSPDICIVNFYKTWGRLGLHKDGDESEDSLNKELPVISFSIGDSAEFLYGDERGVDKAETVILESGDVLIFGGKSRHIFHGVSSIIPNSAPQPLLDKSMLRPGRLNLTFRQY